MNPDSKSPGEGPEPARVQLCIMLRTNATYYVLHLAWIPQRATSSSGSLGFHCGFRVSGDENKNEVVCCRMGDQGKQQAAVKGAKFSHDQSIDECQSHAGPARGDSILRLVGEQVRGGPGVEFKNFHKVDSFYGVTSLHT